MLRSGPPFGARGVPSVPALKEALSRDSVVAALLALAAFAVYGNALGAGFVWDDHSLILLDQRLRSTEHIGEIVARDFFAHERDETAYGYYRPAVSLSYMAEFALWGPRPMGFHGTNVLLHALVVMLVFFLGRRLFPDQREAAIAGALLFCVHPVHTESVTWIAGRTDVLCAALGLSAWLLELRSEDAAPASKRRSLRAAAWLLFFLSLFAKEMAVAVPAMMAVAFWALGGLRPMLTRMAPYAGALGAYLAVRFLVVDVPTGGGADVGALNHLASAATSLFRYLGELLWPWPLEAYLQNPWQDRLSEVAALALLGWGAIAALTYRYRRHPRAWLVPAFLVTFLPLANLIRVSSPPDMGFTMAERFLYLPSVLFCLAMGLALFGRGRDRRLAASLTFTLVLAYSVGTIARNRDYDDELTFFTVTAEQAPEAPLVLGRLGIAQARAGEQAAAIATLERARSKHRELFGAENTLLLNDLANTYRMAGQPARAVELLAGAEAEPLFAFTLGDSLRMLGRLDLAEPALLVAREHQPNNLDVHLALGRLEAARGDHEQALSHYDDARRLFPRAPEIPVGVGDAERQHGDLDAAAAAYELALELAPQSATAHAALGTLAAQRGDAEAARRHLELALERDPRLIEASISLAIVDAQAGQTGAATRRLEEVVRRAPSSPEARYNLALLLARGGRAADARGHVQALLEDHPNHANGRTLLHQLTRARER